MTADSSMVGGCLPNVLISFRKSWPVLANVLMSFRKSWPVHIGARATCIACGISSAVIK